MIPHLRVSPNPRLPQNTLTLHPLRGRTHIHPSPSWGPLEDCPSHQAAADIGVTHWGSSAEHCCSRQAEDAVSSQSRTPPFLHCLEGWLPTLTPSQRATCPPSSITAKQNLDRNPTPARTSFPQLEAELGPTELTGSLLR